MKFSNFTKLLAIIFLMTSFFFTKTLANYEKVFFDFSVKLVNGKSIDLKEGDLLLITGSLYGAAEVLSLN